MCSICNEKSPSFHQSRSSRTKVLSDLQILKDQSIDRMRRHTGSQTTASFTLGHSKALLTEMKWDLSTAATMRSSYPSRNDASSAQPSPRPLRNVSCTCKNTTASLSQTWSSFKQILRHSSHISTSSSPDSIPAFTADMKNTRPMPFARTC